MSVNPYAPPTAVVEDVSQLSQYAGEPPFFAVSIRKLVLLSIFTVNLYSIYWFYQQWKYANQREADKVWPVARAFFAVLFCYPLFKRVRDFQRPSGAASRLDAGGLATAWIIVTVLHKLPDPYWWISVLAFVFLIPVQAEINRLNVEVAPSHNPNTRFTLVNWVFSVIGGLVFALALLGSIVE